MTFLAFAAIDDTGNRSNAAYVGSKSSKSAGTDVRDSDRPLNNAYVTSNAPRKQAWLQNASITSQYQDPTT